jgi:hypothetical protein
LLTFASLPLPDFRGISAANFQPEATGVPDLKQAFERANLGAPGGGR